MSHAITHARDLDLAGIPSQRRTELVRAGSLLRLAPAVYSPPQVEAGSDRQLAVALARLGPDVCIHGQLSAAHRRLDGFPPELVPRQLLVPHHRGALRSEGVEVFRTRHWDLPVAPDGVALSSVVATLLTLGGCTVPRPPDPACRWHSTVPELVEMAVESALRRTLCTLDELRSAVDSAPARRPGVSTLAAILRRRGDAPPTESFLETRALQVLRRAGIAEPLRQVDVGSSSSGPIGRVDFLLGRVVIEADGHQWHDGMGPAQAHRDRERWSELSAGGFIVQLATSQTIELAPDAWAARIRSAIAHDVG